MSVSDIVEIIWHIVGAIAVLGFLYLMFFKNPL